MSVAKTIEVSAESPSSFDAAVKLGIDRAKTTVDNIQGAWIKEHKVAVDDGEITGYRVTMKVTFLLK